MLPTGLAAKQPTKQPTKQPATSAAKAAVRVASKTVNVVVAAVLAFLFLVGCYGLWDSHNVATRASAVQWQPYKPVQPEPLSFWDLQKLNPDVIGWLEVYGTGIDYPVCHSDDMERYLTHNAKGEYSLTGALFLDARNAADFSDFSTIVYGHHMEAEVQFGPISNFQDKAYFDSHEFGNLFSENTDWGLHFFAYVKADAYDFDVYRTDFATQADRRAYLDKLLASATHTRSVDVGPDDRIVLLSTCSSESTNGRTILVGKICDETFENTFVEWPNLGTGVDETPGWLGVPWYAWLAVALWVLLLLALIASTRRKKRRARDEAARDEAARDEAARDEAARDEAARDEAAMLQADAGLAQADAANDEKRCGE